MNIRNLSNPVAPIESLKVNETRTVKTEVSSEDRDADGKKREEEPNKDPLSEEEFKKAKEYLENLAGLRANGLKIDIEEKDNYRIFLIRDETDTVVRRIVEWELRSLLDDKDKKTGQIFDKAV